MNVLIVGDSQAAGPPGQAAERVLTRAGHRVTRLGLPGQGPLPWVREHWLRYRALLASSRPDVVVLMFGANPMGSSFEEALVTFRRSAPAVYYSGPPRYPDRPDVEVRAAAIRRVAQAVFGPRYIDAWPVTGPGVPRMADGLHFTLAGSTPWGRLVAQEVTRSPVWRGAALLGVLALVGLGAGFWWAQSP